MYYRQDNCCPKCPYFWPKTGVKLGIFIVLAQKIVKKCVQVYKLYGCFTSSNGMYRSLQNGNDRPEQSNLVLMAYYGP